MRLTRPYPRAGRVPFPRGWGLSAGLMLAVIGSAGAAPLPPGRPADLSISGRTPPVAPPPPTPIAPGTATTPPSASADCAARLREKGVTLEVAAQPPASDSFCTIEAPVRLLSLADPADPKRAIMLPDRPVVACRFAEPFAQWLGQIAAPVLRAAKGSDLKAVRTGPGFVCRSRNHQLGAKMSAHAIGLALDVAGFDFAEGAALEVKTGAASVGLAAIRTAACGWFTTVLGPGSDPFHSDHLHLDVQLHGSSDRYRICQ